MRLACPLSQRLQLFRPHRCHPRQDIHQQICHRRPLSPALLALLPRSCWAGRLLLLLLLRRSALAVAAHALRHSRQYLLQLARCVPLRQASRQRQAAAGGEVQPRPPPKLAQQQLPAAQGQEGQAWGTADSQARDGWRAQHTLCPQQLQAKVSSLCSQV